ncbi:Gfo/Idh/MocA family oxidoreductase [Actinoallomurus purpureus]|uniref:Gfo/Idh/MocA family oxidoreductase n=1 Tax=Actinoallomurus purpureus TaxID=478114 RepID=UPI002091FBAB|nr:Gfo/Idh/MocA family oxidoreductase [Actinoallomurus purpureus]MCO6003807.1 Gfo/Idh/MocA family oxidoreductase [Actinoallomurus purpureus]
MTTPVRIGLAGYGFGGRYFHAPLLASATEYEFLGVVTTSPERREQVAADLDRPAYASLSELAAAGASPASEGERWGVEPEERWGSVRRGDEAEPVPSERGRWDLFYPAFAAAVRGTGPLPVDPWDAVATATVLDAARASATSGQVVALS